MLKNLKKMKILLSESVSLILLYISIFFLFIGFYWIYKIFYSYNWLKNKRKKIKNVDYTQIFYVIIPVLNEEKIIKQTSKYFLKILKKYKNSKLVFVTTAKEKEKTIDIINNITNKTKKVLHFHYNQTDGVMAHQLNYAIKKILKNKKNKNNYFFVIYNADSRPNQKTFNYVFSKEKKNKNVFQQYGNYALNIDSFNNSYIFSSLILYASASWQNRWSLGIELFKGINNLNNFKLLKPISYCIGHGLFIKKNVLKKVGYFCTKTHNEDSILGFTLNNLNEKIYPIPYFDKCESPNLLSTLFYQKINWFFGPGQFIDYYKIIKKKKLYKNILMLLLYTIKMMFLATSWLFGPLLFLFFLLLSLTNTYLFFYFIFVYIIFLVIPNYFGLILLNKKIKQNRIIIFLKIFIGSFFAYILHGISGWVGFFKYLLKKIFNIKIKKDKTFILRK